MELDNLRRRWQQQPSGPLTSSETTQETLNQMLQQRTTGPIAQLRHNVQRDARIIVPLVVLNLLNFWNISLRDGLPTTTRYLMLGFLIILLSTLTISIFRRKQLVHQMETADGDLYSQLKTSARQLRQLLNSTRLMAVVMLVAVCGLFLFKMQDKLRAYLNPATAQWGEHVVVFTLGILGLALVVATLYTLGRAKQQRRYGQYIDQLEATLRELEA